MAQSMANLYDQLKAVRLLAVQEGYVDAADFIQFEINRIQPTSNDYRDRLSKAGLQTIPGKFYTRFRHETIKEAVFNHSTGYNSLQEAIDDTNANKKMIGEQYVVYNHNLEIVFEGETK